MLNYEITQKADEDIFSAIAYIKNELFSVDAAKNLYAEIFKTIEDLTIFAEAHTVISRSKHVYRRAMVNNYKLIYYVEDNTVVIARLYAPRQLIEEESNI